MHSLHGIITGLPPLDVPLHPINSLYDYDNPQPLDIISVIIPEDEWEIKRMIPMQNAWMVFNFNNAMFMDAGLPNDLSTTWFIGYHTALHWCKLHLTYYWWCLTSISEIDTTLLYHYKYGIYMLNKEEKSKKIQVIQ